MSLQEQRRAGFEVHAVARGLAITRAPEAYMFSNGRRVPVGGYILAETAVAWEAWNDALDSAVVDLPDIYPLPEGDGLEGDPDIWEMQMDIANAANSMRGQCAKAITAAGLKVKP